MNSAKVMGPWRAIRRRMARSAWVGGKSVVVGSVAILLLLDRLGKVGIDSGGVVSPIHELLPPPRDNDK